MIRGAVIGTEHYANHHLKNWEHQDTGGTMKLNILYLALTQTLTLARMASQPHHSALQTPAE